VVDLSGTDANETLVGTAADDVIDGGAGSDSLVGGAGNDTLLGTSSDFGDYNEDPYADTLEGGAGDDLLRGGGGDDLYLFNLGDGRDTINDEYFYQHKNELGGVENPLILDGGLDTLKFGAGINPADVLVTIVGDDLYIGVAEGSTDIFDLANLVEIENWQASVHRVENIEFNDGTVWGDAEIRSRLVGTSGD
jgi:Ca2+-binding RTX toxin-like protein